MSIRNVLLHVLSIIGFAAAATADTEHPSRGPELLFRGPGDAKPTAAPHLSMQVAISVTGPVTRARVLQRFWNDSDGWVEGVYVFPLPEGAAVDALRMRVGGRLFEGEVREREEAKRTYQRARSSGNKASLVEQERPNLFTVKVANVGPGEEVEIEIEYQELLRYVDGGFELRFPMTLTPRFVSDAPSTMVADATHIEPPMLEGGDARGCVVDLDVVLDPGFGLTRLESPTHGIVRTGPLAPVQHVGLQDIPADRDFVLRWWPEHGAEPSAALFSEEKDGDLYVMAMVLPPAADAPILRLSRELVLVIDTSGSMGGASIRQARAALDHALDALGPDDFFNVIRFDSRAEALFYRSRRADAAAVRSARAFVGSLMAGGGTVMQPALEAAFLDEGLSVAVRQVVFLTDGAVGNEARLFDVIEQQLGRTRLFPVGIGSAPNQHFLRRAARFGRGATVAIARAEEVEERMNTLLDRIERPVLTELDVHWNDRVEMWPRRIPDLHDGEPLVITARVPRFVGHVVISGRRGERPWEVRLPLEPGVRETGIARVWARRKIASLMDARRRARHAAPARARLRAEVVEVALAHQLVSRFTSLIAVDVTPERPLSEGLARGSVASLMPAGSAAPASMLPVTATSAGQLRMLGALCWCACLVLLGLRGSTR